MDINLAIANSRVAVQQVMQSGTIFAAAAIAKLFSLRVQADFRLFSSRAVSHFLRSSIPTDRPIIYDA